MSYARLSNDSDVYVYLDVSGLLCCAVCSLVPIEIGRTFLRSCDEMIEHLGKHVQAGELVPQRTFAIFNDKTERAYIRAYSTNLESSNG